MTLESGREYAPAVPHKYLPVQGVATYLHHVGPTTLPHVVPDTRKGHALLCIHGASGNGNQFRPLLERLGANHSPFAFDFPAHARSAGIDSLESIPRMAEFAKGVAERLGLAAPVLVGHSMGGMVAQEYALRFPGAVRALVLIGTTAKPEIPEAMYTQLRRITEGKARREFTRDAFSPATPPEIIRQNVMEDLKTDPRASLGDLLAIRGWSAADRLGQIRVPTLVIFGEDEIPRIKQGSEALAAGIPGAKRVEIPKAGHMVTLEQTQAVADAIEAFLAQVPR